MLVIGKTLISENLHVGNLPSPSNDSPDRDNSKKKMTFLESNSVQNLMLHHFVVFVW